MRIVIELKRDAIADVVLNQLWRHSDLQTNFGANMLAINGGRPEQLNLRDMISAFTAFREEVASRRTKHLLAKSRDRAHVLVGLAVAVANIDAMILLIRAAPSPAEAREQMMARDWPAKDIGPLVELIADPRHRIAAAGTIRLSDVQARAILDLRLQRLTALGRDEIKDELDKLAAEIADYLDILRSRARIQGIVKDELAQVKKDFASPRRTGKGRSGMQTRDEDFVTRLFVANTHTPVLFFSSHGRVYKEKVWRLPAAAPQARGKALINILPLNQGERVTTVMPLPEDESTWAQLDVMFATTRGTVRRNKLSDFVDVRRSGIIAMKLDEGEAIVDVQICTEKQDVLLTTAAGQCIRFPVPDVRVFQGRTSMGVRGIALAEGDRVISLSILRHLDATAEERAAYLKRASAVRRGITAEAEEPAPDAEEATGAIELGEQRYVEMSEAEQFVLTLSERGYGKRSPSYEYRTTGRGGKGIVAMAVTGKTGRVVASFPVEDQDQIMLVTNGGQLIRTRVEGIRIASRSTQGVIVFDTDENEKVVSVERISEEGDDNGG